MFKIIIIILIGVLFFIGINLFLYSCCVISSRCSREEEKLKEFYNKVE